MLYVRQPLICIREVSGMFVCQTCKGTALILAVESDGRLCFEECPDCNPHPESRLPIFEDN